MHPHTTAVSRLRDQGAPQSHLQRISTLTTLAESTPALRAIFLVGSYARGAGDRVSDLDLAVFAAPDREQEVLALLKDALCRTNVLHRFSGRHAGGGSFVTAVYLDFSSVEFHVFEPTAAFRLKRPFLVVWDPSHLLASVLIDGEPVRHEDFAAYEHGDPGLLWELVDCIKWLSRGQAELAKNHLRKLSTALGPARADGCGAA